MSKFWFLKTILYKKEPEFFWEIANSRAGAGKVQDEESGVSYDTRK